MLFPNPGIGFYILDNRKEVAKYITVDVFVLPNSTSNVCSNFKFGVIKPLKHLFADHYSSLCSFRQMVSSDHCLLVLMTSVEYGLHLMAGF